MSEVIEVGDYVRVVVNTEYFSAKPADGAIGVVRDFFSDLSGSYVEFSTGLFGFIDDELELVRTLTRSPKRRTPALHSTIPRTRATSSGLSKTEAVRVFPTIIP